MRWSARPRKICSGSIFAGVAQEPADQLDEAGGDAQEEKNQIKEVRAEALVQQIADGVADKGRGGQEKGERGVFASSVVYHNFY